MLFGEFGVGVLHILKFKCAPSFVASQFDPDLTGYGSFVPCQPVYSIGLIQMVCEMFLHVIAN